MKKEKKDKTTPKGETPFERFELLAKKVVRVRKDSLKKPKVKRPPSNAPTHSASV